MCTRFLWSSGGEPGEGHVMVGRSMDWFEDTDTILAVRPRGEQRESAQGDSASFSWEAKYGSIVALMYKHLSVDGVNEERFQVSGLYLAESDYGERDYSRPGLHLKFAVQYLLDSFATVAEAVTWLRENDIQIIPIEVGGMPGTAHLSLADKHGDSAIIEFLDGKTSIHHGKEFAVMANSPTYDVQLKLVKRYAGMGGADYLPGGTDSPDRFARAAFYSSQLPHTSDARESAAHVFSVIRNASAPFGTVDPARPNVSATRWRSVANLTHGVYFFESTTSPNVIWVSLDDIDFGEGSGERTLDLINQPDHTGDVSALFSSPR